MLKSMFFAVAVVLVVVTSALAINPEDIPGLKGEKDPQKIVTLACTLCHSPERICKALGAKGKDGWYTTVTQMMFNGAPIDHEQKTIVAEWLYSARQPDLPLCNK